MVAKANDSKMKQMTLDEALCLEFGMSITGVVCGGGLSQGLQFAVCWAISWKVREGRHCEWPSAANKSLLEVTK